MGYFREEFLQARRQEFLESIAKAQANVGSPEEPEWVDGKTLQAFIDDEGLIIFKAAFLDLVYNNDLVCQIRLLDKDGLVASQRDVSIQTAIGQGVYTTLTVNLFESDMEVS